MGVLVFVEDAGDEFSQQALGFARTVAGDGGVDAVSIAGDYAAAAWGQTLADLVSARGPSAVIAPGSDRGNEVLAHAAAILDLPLSTNTTAFIAGDPPTVTRVRWGGSLLEEALLRGPTMLMTVAPHAVAAETAAVEVELVTAS
jgi:electron transfer flavoprotein alpha subunit